MVILTQARAVNVLGFASEDDLRASIFDIEADILSMDQSWQLNPLPELHGVSSFQQRVSDKMQV